MAYRYWTQREASKRKLIGFVRNRRDGRVEARFCGAPEQVDDMIDACRKGPPAARVDALECRAISGAMDASAFEILSTV